MNTYFNEITSKPVNTSGGGAVYKIPAGAMCGNGDLGVVFDNDGKELIIHISKCDFWKFTPGAHKDGGIKTVGSLRIKGVDLSEYNIKQYFDKGLLECRFGSLGMEFFVAPENLIYFELKAPESDILPTVEIEIPDTCNSLNSEFSENGIDCYVRRFEGENLERNSAVITCCRKLGTRTADGFDYARYCISVVTNFDAEQYSDKGVDMALHGDYDRDKAIKF